MPNTDLAHVIIEMVEGFLKRGDREHALIIPVSLRYKRDCFDAQFFIFRGTAYTTVGTRVTSSIALSAEKWDLEVHHDSAWRDDGVRHAISKWEREFRVQMECERTGINPNIEASFYASPRLVDVVDVAKTREFVHVTYKP